MPEGSFRIMGSNDLLFRNIFILFQMMDEGESLFRELTKVAQLSFLAEQMVFLRIAFLRL